MSNPAPVFSHGPYKSILSLLTYPGNVRSIGGQKVLSSIVQETDIDQSLDELGETGIAKGAAEDGVGLGDVVALLVGGRVAVGVTDKGEGGVDRDGLGRVHEVVARVLDNVAILVEFGVVLQGQEHAAGGPGELVAERVVGGLGGRETTAVGQEGKNLNVVMGKNTN